MAVWLDLLGHGLWFYGVEPIVNSLKTFIPKQVERLDAENYRRDVNDVLRQLDAADHNAFRVLDAWIDTALRTGTPDIEDNVIRALGNALPRDAAGKVNMPEAVQLFRWLVSRRADGFARFVAVMKHDWTAQHIRRAGRQVVDFVSEVERIAREYDYGNIRAFAGRVGERTGGIARDLAEVSRAGARALDQHANIIADRLAIPACTQRIRDTRRREKGSGWEAFKGAFRGPFSY